MRPHFSLQQYYTFLPSAVLYRHIDIDIDIDIDKDQFHLFFAPRTMHPCPPFSTTRPSPLHCPYACTSEHNRGPDQDSSWKAVAEEPDAEEKTDKFAHVKRDGDTEGGCSRAE